jgi:hypothetical protein
VRVPRREHYASSSTSLTRTTQRDAAHGVPWIWIVDPTERSVERFESESGLPRQSRVAEDGETVVLPPFDLPIAIHELWGKTAA